MRVFMSVDMEGIAGIVDWDQVTSKKPDYLVGRELMTGEAAAAVEGALEAGAREVVVGDSHGSMFNLLAEKMPPAARLVQGRCKPLSMMQGISKGFDAAAFIGYHAKYATQGGVLAHTYSGSIRECWVNRVLMGEPGLNGMMAAYYGAPLVFLSGDEAACREARALIPGIETAAVKKGFGTKTCSSLHPQLARDAVRAGIKKALTSKFPAKTKLPKPPFTLRLVMARAEMADMCEMIPGVRRKGAMELEFKDEDYQVVYGAFLTIMRIAGTTAGD